MGRLREVQRGLLFKANKRGVCVKYKGTFVQSEQAGHLCEGKEEKQQCYALHCASLAIQEGGFSSSKVFGECCEKGALN